VRVALESRQRVKQRRRLARVATRLGGQLGGVLFEVAFNDEQQWEIFRDLASVRLRSAVDGGI